MTINGVQSLIYGVDDLDRCVKFYEDFGLHLAHRDGAGAEFLLPEGSQVVLRRRDDPTLRAPYADEPGAREVIWGVDTPEALDALEQSLARDRDLRRDADGTLHLTDDVGIPIGFRVFRRMPPLPVESAENTLGRISRWNANRQWFKRAEPKLMHHVVFGVQDVDAGVDFYTRRLGFRISDIARDNGVFLRCEGRNDHHNLFLQRAPALAFRHVSFGVENVDEVMTGANEMQRRGWTSNVGIGRHRISSTLFYYVRNPAGGEAEYSADTDYLTDAWKPRLWAPIFGNFHWVGSIPNALREAPQWEYRVLEEPIPPFSQLLS